jgi:putative ABC transport system permease protein
MAGNPRCVRLSRWLFRVGLLVLPSRFRRRHGEDLTLTFEARLESASSSSRGAVLRLMVRELSGLMWIGVKARASGARADERVRDGSRVRRAGLADTIARDVRTTLRGFRRSPGFALIAVVVLGLGIGASVTIFSAVNAVLLQRLPLRDADRLVAMWESNRERGWVRGQVAPANYLDWTERLQGFEGVAAYNDWQDAVELGGAEPRQVLANAVTGNFFDVIGVKALLGRGFTDAETWLGTERVAVLSWPLWQSAFGGDPDVVGRPVMLNRIDYRVVGVMPPGLRFPREQTDLWLPVRWDQQSRGQDWFRRAHMVRAVGRLAGTVSVERADAELEQVGRALQAQYPELDRGMEPGLGPLREYLSREARTPLILLLSAVGLLLLTACANVSNLVLVRGISREREIAVRGALGASRWRLLSQLVTENAILGLLGGGIGLALGLWGTRLIALHRPLSLESWRPIAVNANVVGFAILITTVCVVLSGILPALRGARTGLTHALRDATRATSSIGPTRASRSLVVAEIALASLLVFGAGMLARSVLRLRTVDPGFDASNVLTLRLNLPAAEYDSGDRVMGFWDDLLERIRQVPGVASAAGVTRLPLTTGNWTSDFTVEGWPAERHGTDVNHREATPGYFETLRVPLLRGRLLDERDKPGAAPAGVPLEGATAGGSPADPGVLINETLARRYFRDENPIGRRITFDRIPTASSFWRTIVGVVGDERQQSPASAPLPEFMAPLAVDVNRSLSLTIRTNGDPLAMVASVREVIHQLDPALPIEQVRTMTQVRTASLSRERFLTTLIGLFASFTLLLAIMGVWGVSAQAAKSRTHEIGIRMALGARSADVEWLMLRHGLFLVAAGIAIGGLGALAAGRLITGLVASVDPTDPATFGVVGVTLAATGILANWIPARLAARTDPLRALRID